MSYTLRLEDDVDSIDFISDSGANFYLLDGSLDIPAPDVEGVEAKTTNPTPALISASLSERNISFAFQVTNTSTATVITSLNRVYRMLNRAMNARQLAGGSHGSSSGFNSSTGDFSGTQTGDQGLRLIVRYGAVGSTSITNEVSQSTTDTRLYTFKVVTGKLTPENPFSVEGSNKMRGLDTLLRCAIELTCYPLALGPAQMAVTNAGLHSSVYGDASATSTWTNRIVIASASIPGTHDALTRMYIDTGGYYGVIVGRDAGASLLNCPSYANYRLIPVGIYENALSRVYEVNVVSVSGPGVPTIRWRVNGGSYSSNIALSTAYEVTTMDSGGAFYPTTVNWTGVTPGTTYTFRNNQSSLILNESITLYDSPTFTNRDAFMSEDGITVTSQAILVQPGITGAYKIFVGFFPAVIGNEYEMKIEYSVSNTDDLVMIASTGWQRCPTTGSWLADCGVLDLSPSGLRGSGHPKGVKTINATIKIRGVDVPTSGASISVDRMLIVPALDPNSFIRTAWIDSGENVIFSNFDAEAPYTVASGRGMFTAGTTSVQNTVVPLAETHEGNIITLVPGVTNTVVVYPLSVPFITRDFRVAIPSVGDTPTTRIDLAVRPRYMFVG